MKIWKEGRHFIGMWDDGQMNGYGKYVWSDGKTYEGQYLNDTKEGFGVYSWPDGRTYCGFWKDGKQHGLAEWKASGSNQIRYGQWSEGKRLKWFNIDETRPLQE